MSVFFGRHLGPDFAAYLKSRMLFADGTSAAPAVKSAAANGKIKVTGDDTSEFFDYTLATNQVDIEGKGGDDTILTGTGDDKIKGDDGNDSIVAGAGDDTVNAGADDDIVSGGTGNDDLDGKTGFDTAVYSGSILDFTVVQTDDFQYIVTDQNIADGDEGADVVSHFEQLQFDDYTLNINGDNNIPLILGDDQMTDEETAISFVISAYDFDGDTLTLDDLDISGPGTLTATEVLDPFLGTGTAFTISFDPAGAYDYLAVGETAMESVRITISDGNGGADTLSLDIAIEGVNDAPVAVDDTATTDEDISVNIIVLGNDTDPDTSDILTVTTATALHGDVVVEANGSLTYTPDTNYNGPDTITYEISDGNGGTDSAEVAVTVNPVNDAPVADAANDPAIAADEANGTVVLDLGARVSDVDGDDITISQVALIDADTGTRLTIPLTLVDGVLSFDPVLLGLDEGQSQTLLVQYTATDDSGEPNDSTIGFVDLTVAGADEGAPPVNEAPEAGDTSVTAAEADGPFEVDLTGIATDPDGDTLTFVSVITASGEEVDFSVVGSVLTIDPVQFGLDDGEQEQILLNYTVDDGKGAGNSQATGLITLDLTGAADGPPPDPTNLAPVANTVVDTVNEEDGDVIIDLTAEVSDPDGDPLTITSVTITGGITATFTLESGILAIDPASFGLDTGETDTFIFEYTVEDDSNQANSETTGTIELTVNGFTEIIVEPPEGPVVMDFEAYEEQFDSAVAISGDQGFGFSGATTVIETDELASDGRNPGGVVNGQTTEGGNNVLVGTFSTAVVPVLDENGDPVIDPETREPVTEIVVEDQFGIFGPGTTFGLDDTGLRLFTGTPGNPPPVPDPLPTTEFQSFGASFSLDGLSLNVSGTGTATVTITLYTIGVVELPSDFVPSSSDYYLQYAAADSFEFTVDGSTPATELDFNDLALSDDNGAVDTTAFDDIYAITFETDDGTAIVLDDVLLTL